MMWEDLERWDRTGGWGPTEDTPVVSSGGGWFGVDDGLGLWGVTLTCLSRAVWTELWVGAGLGSQPTLCVHVPLRHLSWWRLPFSFSTTGAVGVGHHHTITQLASNRRRAPLDLCHRPSSGQ